VDLEPGDRLGGGAGDLGDQIVIVVDAPGVLGGLDGEGASGVGDADVDALPGDDQGASAADPPLDPYRVGCWRGWWAGGAGGAGVAQAALFDRGERVGQAA
jgi:hypothetical protein